MSANPFVGRWTYRSLLNEADPTLAFDKLEFGVGTLVIADAPNEILTGNIGDGTSWSLALQGSRQYGTPGRARFQGVGVVNGEKWVYDYECYLVPHWPNGVNQRPALVGSVIRTLPHAGGEPGTVAPAGVVASFYAVKSD